MRNSVSIKNPAWLLTESDDVYVVGLLEHWFDFVGTKFFHSLTTFQEVLEKKRAKKIFYLLPKTFKVNSSTYFTNCKYFSEGYLRLFSHLETIFPENNCQIEILLVFFLIFESPKIVSTQEINL